MCRREPLCKQCRQVRPRIRLFQRPSSESCAVIVHTVYAQKPARFVEIDVAGLVKRVFNVYPTVRAETFEGRVGKLTVNVAAIKF